MGIYGMIARTVVQRTGEIGVRMALGAQIHDVVRLILGLGIRVAIVGQRLACWVRSVFHVCLHQCYPPCNSIRLWSSLVRS